MVSNLSVIAAPLCGAPRAGAAVWVSGLVGVNVGETLPFRRFIVYPPPPIPLELKTVLALDRALAEVWRPCALQTLVLSAGSALAYPTPKVCTLIIFFACAIQKRI